MSDDDGGALRRGEKRKGWPRALRPAYSKTTVYRDSHESHDRLWS